VLAGEQVTMPTQDRVGLYEQPAPAQLGPGQVMQQGSKPGPIGRTEPWPLPTELAM
jgi:hypothetical protein